MRESRLNQYREIRNQTHPTHPFRQSTLFLSRPAEPLGVMLLPLSLELAAIDSYLVDNKGAVRSIGTVGGDKKREL